MLSPDGLSDIKRRLTSRYLDTEQMLTDLLHLVETVEQLEEWLARMTQERDEVIKTLSEECDRSRTARAEVEAEVETRGLAQQYRDAVASLDQLRGLARAVTECPFTRLEGDANEQQHRVFRAAIGALREASEGSPRGD